MRRAVVTEKQVQAAVKRLLQQMSVAVYDLSQPFRALITPGVPDLACFHPRRGLFFVEVKRPGGRQSKAQRAFQARCQAAGVPYVMGGVQQVAEFLNSERRSA